MSIHLVFKSPTKADVAVVFLHGLNVSGASGLWRDTWRADGLAGDDHGWPAWLGQDLATRGVATNVYAVDYPSHAMKWNGASMPMLDQAALVLEELDLGLADESQIYFVCYSLGGLVLKKMLSLARGRSSSKAAILARSKGIIFLSTPHQGAKIAEVVNFWLKGIARTTITIAELEQSHPGLRELAEAFAHQAAEHQWAIYQYGEARPTSGVLVVDPWSAHSGVGDPPVSLDEDHLTICKLRDPGTIVFQRTLRMIETGASAKASAPVAAPPRAQTAAAAVAEREHRAVGEERHQVPDEYAYDVFLSHSSQDKPRVREVAERLRALGLRVWFEEWTIQHGDSIFEKIEDGLEQSRMLLLFMSQHAFGSDWATLQQHTVRFRDPLNRTRRFVAARLDDTAPKGTLATFKYFDWRGTVSEADCQIIADRCRP